MGSPAPADSGAAMIFHFRPWVRKAGMSILVITAVMTVLVIVARQTPGGRWGWASEPAVQLYLLALWGGSLKIVLTTLRPAAELADEVLTLRPVHQLRGTVVRWSQISGTEQMTGGDRLIVYFNRGRGLRFVALNLNLIRGRREFERALESRLRSAGFAEKTIDRSRYLTHPSARPEGSGVDPRNGIIDDPAR